jgi:predicted  nucleic acid-binding Zn-ribbon protein
VVPQLVRQYQARIDSLEAERVKAREQLLAARGEISRLSEELKQERERSLRLERKLRGSDFG